MHLSFYLAASLLLPFVSAASSQGDPEQLYKCLRTRDKGGYELETPKDANYTKDRAAFNQRLSFEPVALVFP
jgi:hypothetical protein